MSVEKTNLFATLSSVFTLIFIISGCDTIRKEENIYKDQSENVDIEKYVINIYHFQQNLTWGNPDVAHNIIGKFDSYVENRSNGKIYINILKNIDDEGIVRTGHISVSRSIYEKSDFGVAEFNLNSIKHCISLNEIKSVYGEPDYIDDTGPLNYQGALEYKRTSENYLFGIGYRSRLSKVDFSFMFSGCAKNIKISR